MDTSHVVVVGSANADLVARVERHPGPGETVLGSDLEVHPGGKGANQAVAAARLGARVALVGRVGGDSYADLLIAALHRDGVDTSALRRGAAPTGVALITVNRHGENAIVVAPGANARLTAEEVESAVPGFPAAKVVTAQMEIPPEAVVAAARSAERLGARFVLNASPPDPLGDRALARELLPLCDPLVVNEHEALFLTGGTADPLPALLRLGVRSAVVTLGARGAAVAEAARRPPSETGGAGSGDSGGGRGGVRAPGGADGRSGRGSGGEAVVSVPGVPVEVVDTTGAGDAFTGALAWRLSLGSDLVDAARWAVRVGAAAVRAYGAQSAYPDVEGLPRPLP